ncbi:MAG: hypothetical protein HYS98_06455 [Deltaproteobacteria bacterium]|nr:hypothetical protein [Deltaproteobacteria bacterium]
MKKVGILALTLVFAGSVWAAETASTVTADAPKKSWEAEAKYELKRTLTTEALNASGKAELSASWSFIESLKAGVGLSLENSVGVTEDSWTFGDVELSLGSAQLVASPAIALELPHLQASVTLPTSEASRNDDLLVAGVVQFNTERQLANWQLIGGLKAEWFAYEFKTLIVTEKDEAGIPSKKEVASKIGTFTSSLRGVTTVDNVTFAPSFTVANSLSYSEAAEHTFTAKPALIWNNELVEDVTFTLVFSNGLTYSTKSNFADVVKITPSLSLVVIENVKLSLAAENVLNLATEKPLSSSLVVKPAVEWTPITNATLALKVEATAKEHDLNLLRDVDTYNGILNVKYVF